MGGPLPVGRGRGPLAPRQALKALEENPGDHAALRTLLAESTKDGSLPSPQGLGNMFGAGAGPPGGGPGARPDRD